MESYFLMSCDCYSFMLIPGPWLKIFSFYVHKSFQFMYVCGFMWVHATHVWEGFIDPEEGYMSLEAGVICHCELTHRDAELWSSGRGRGTLNYWAISQILHNSYESKQSIYLLMTGSLYVAQIDLKFGVFLLLPLEYSNYSGPLESVTNTLFA